ncbi:MAG TPA: cytochrome c oxidase subunit II [Xanthobacteraceae bacterium]|nr:cytochrome c oxidase subunit II [Xanthobacteraceae bacterium]
MNVIVRIACLFGEMAGMHCGPSNGQSTFDPASRPATLINDMHWWMYYGFGLVEAAVVIVLFWALWRGARRRRAEGAAVHKPSRRTERNLFRAVAICAVLTVAILFTSLIGSLAVTWAINKPGLIGQQVEIVGRQWWWEIRYIDQKGKLQFTTANEINIPVGEPVQLYLDSPDVIHSFWVPSLHGKQDLIPGHSSMLTIEANRPGIYRGQCAEFCGLQHAKMAIEVIAQPPQQFAQWFNKQMSPASASAATRSKGEALFASAGCASCHTIRGTSANGKTGPDLTHVGSRRSLASGTLSNTPGSMARWIRDPQAIKPGTQMATSELPADEIAMLVSYLEGLR